MPFGGSHPNYQKLRTNLRLCINRFKLLEKKKTELALKSRKEIADYISAGKDDRARIRVEHIIREDYMVEAMEILEMFCDLLLARFGLIDKMKEMDPALEEPISTIIWATPRLISDVPELGEVSKQLIIKYGKEWGMACRNNTLERVNEKVMVKMGVAAPPKKLIEQYMIEIAKSFNVPFEPDPSAMVDDQIPDVSTLIDLGFDPKNPGGGSGGSGGGGGGLPAGAVDTMPPPPVGGFMPPMPQPVNHAPPFTLPQQQPQQPPFPGQHSYPSGGTSGPPPLPSQPPNAMTGSAPPNVVGYPNPAGHVPGVGPGPYNMPAGAVPGQGPNYVQNGPDGPRLPSYDEVLDDDAVKKPGIPSFQSQNSNPSAPPPSSMPPPLPSVPPAGTGSFTPDLPSVPTDNLGGTSANDDIDFDDLTKRFEELKKKK